MNVNPLVPSWEGSAQDGPYKKRSLAIVMPLATQTGGAEQMLLDLLSNAHGDARWDITLAFLEDGPMVVAARSMGYEAQVICAGRIREPMSLARVVGNLAGWIGETRPSVVLSWMSKAHLYGGLAAWRAGVPAVWFQHGITTGHWLDRLVTCVPAVGVLCCSEAAQQAQRRLHPVRRTQVVAPSVDLDRFSESALPTPAACREALKLHPAGPIVVMVARLQRWKGVHVFVEAAQRVRVTHPDAQFVVVGGTHALEPGYADEVQGASARSGDIVQFMGYRSDVPLWMQAADVIVHASVEPEPFGIVILEALALGKSVIASNAGGAIEILRDGEGRLTPPGDARALGEAIIQLLSESESVRQVRARRARARADAFSARGLPARLEVSIDRLLP